jgi:hypothetical protein
MTARRNSKWVLMLDGKPFGPEMDTGLTWKVDSTGEHVAVAGKIGGNWTWVVNGVPRSGFDVISDIAASPSTRTPAGSSTRRGAAAFKEGYTDRALRRIVIDGQAGPEFDAYNIAYLDVRAEGKSHHYTVIGADGSRDLVIFNGVASRLYDRVIEGSARFIDDRTIEFLAFDAQRFLRVTSALE